MHGFLRSSIPAMLCLGMLAQWPAAAQFEGLTTTGNGSALYFSSPIRQKGTNQTFHSKIFEWDASGGIRVYAEVTSEGQSDGCVTNSFYRLTAPQVSDDGTVVAYTASRPGPDARFCPPVETSQGIVALPGSEVTLAGDIALSRNGRYAITTPLAAITDSFHIVTDLTSGTSTAIAGAFDGSAQRVTDDATVVTPQPSAVIVTDRTGGTRVFQTKYPVDDAIIDRSGKTIVYVTNLAPGPTGSVEPGRISAVDLTSGSETQLAIAFAPGNPILTSDGATVFYTDGPQMYAMGVRGSGLRQVTSAAGPIEAVVVSGDGLTAFAITAGGSLVRIDVTSGTSTQLAAAPPFLGAAYRVFPPATTIAAVGSVMSLYGGGLSNTRQLTFCGQSVPFKTVSQGILQFQVPWNSPEGPCQAIVQTDSPFEDGIDLEVREFDPQFVGYPTAFLAHQNFAGAITSTAPAQPGEVIVAYMTGLGPVDSTGQLTTPGFTCSFDGVTGTLMYAGAAPGFTGFYQVNVTAPNLSPRSASLECGWSAQSFLAFTSVWIGY